MCLKLSFFHFKLDLQTILSLTVLSNCVSGSLNFDTAFFPDCIKFCIVFFVRLLDMKFYENSRNVLKTVILSLQVGFIDDFVRDSPFKVCFWQFKL